MKARALALVVALLAVPMAGIETSSASDHRTIQPGDPLVDDSSSSYCTLSFVFDSQTNESVYMSTAAHCVDPGQQVRTLGYGSLGEVVFHGGGPVSEDFALIEVDESVRDEVRADVRGYPGMPTGLATPEDTMVGDLVFMSGWGTLTTETETTRENRSGVLFSHDERLMQAQTSAHPGDSGGPWTHQSGKALGIVSQISVGFGVSGETVDVPGAGEVTAPLPSAFAGNQGPTVQGLLAEAQASGYDLTLRTAN